MARPPNPRPSKCPNTRKEPEAVITSWTQRNPLSNRIALDLDGADLGLEVVQFLLHGGVLLGHLLVLGLPLVALLLEGLDFPLEVSSLDVGLPQPRKEAVSVSEVGQVGNACASLLLVGLAQSPVCFLGLFLEKLEPSSQRFVLGTVLLAFAGRGLELLDLRLGFLYLRLKHAVLVRKGDNLLLLLEVLLLERLDLALELLDLGRRLLGVQAELVHFLECATYRQPSEASYNNDGEIRSSCQDTPALEIKAGDVRYRFKGRPGEPNGGAKPGCSSKKKGSGNSPP